MSARKLVLIDGSAYLYRAFHALPPLATADGRPTGAVYGVVNMLKKMLREDAPTHVAVVFDAPGKTFRDELFEAYKANRPHMPDDMAAQIGPLIAVIRALGLPLIQESGVEADDVIATLAIRASAAGFEVEIGTADKDMAQLVNERITLVDTMRGTRRDRAGVEERFGVPPECIVDLLALMGDTSDNIPGVPGVGQKTAAKWLQQYGSLAEVRAHAGDIKGKVGEKLRAHLADLDLSYKLATVRCDLALPLGPDDLIPAEPDVERLRELYRDLEFKGWLAELTEAPPAVERSYVTVADEAALAEWIVKIEQAEIFALDTETTSLNYLDARIVGVSFAVAPGEAAYIPLAHTEAQPFERESVLARLKPILEDPERAKLGHHLKYDAHALANHGIALAGTRHDTLLESYVLNPTAGRHDLDSLCRRMLEENTTAYEEICGKGKKQIGFEDVPIATAAPYAAEDADVSLRLHHALWPRLQKTGHLREVYEQIELPLVPVLLAMERRGVLIDRERLAAQSTELAREMLRLQGEAWRVAETRFNLDSPSQLGELLYEHFGLAPRRKTPGGKPSTAESVLVELAAEHALPRIVLDYRALAKLRSTYTEKLPASADAGGRVHTSYNQTGASTGRLSSSDPNLQNIPVRTEEGRRIRQAFIAPPDSLIVAADYSQIELRIMAHLSGDEGLRRAFAEGRDIHRATASEVFGKSLDAVSANERRAAKAINFGLIYGMSAFGLARNLGIARDEASLYIERYFERYPGVRRYMDETRKNAKQNGYVETLFGRRLYVPEIASRNGARRQAAERAAINAPMQGTAADIIKRAMIAIHAWSGDGAAGVQLIMQVHDELVFEVAEDRLEEASARIRADMQGAAELAVPLVVDVGHGRNWDEAH